MSELSREQIKTWISPQFLMHAAVSLCSLVAMFATLRTDVADLNRRVGAVELVQKQLPTDYVPRKEHESRDELEKEQRSLLMDRLAHIERQLEDLTARRR